jgi:hypothetical protein
VIGFAVASGLIMSGIGIRMNIQMHLWSWSAAMKSLPIVHTSESPTPESPNVEFSAKKNLSDNFLCVVWFVVAATYSTTTVYIGMKGKTYLWLEWAGVALSLIFWGWMGVTAEEDFLVILPFTTSIMLLIGYFLRSIPSTYTKLEEEIGIPWARCNEKH